MYGELHVSKFLFGNLMHTIQLNITYLVPSQDVNLLMTFFICSMERRVIFLWLQSCLVRNSLTVSSQDRLMCNLHHIIPLDILGAKDLKDFQKNFRVTI